MKVIILYNTVAYRKLVHQCLSESLDSYVETRHDDFSVFRLPIFIQDCHWPSAYVHLDIQYLHLC